MLELSFLRIFATWEDFLEETFIRYMCRGKTASAYCPKCYATPTSMEHALAILKGSRPFASWTSPSEIRERAKLFFKGGEPYENAVASAARELEEMRQIRNSVAHRSGSAWDQFQDMARKNLGYRPRGLSPGSFLATSGPAPGKRFFEFYCDTIIALAGLIVP
jgi:hypothetical protein